MRDRAALILKAICLCLAAWLAWELVQAGRNANPLADVAIPDVPTLPADTNAPPPVANQPPARPATNAIVAAGANATNGPAVAADTNAAPHKKAHSTDTNAAAIALASASTNSPDATNLPATTNLVMTPPTNAPVIVVADTNAPIAATTNAPPSNSAPVTVASSPTNISGSNVVVAAPTNALAAGTNINIAKTSGGTNVVADSARTNSTNSATAKASSRRPPNAAIAAMPGGPGGKKASTLPPEIQARVDRVYESEIFAPINHPMPMALMGIAGNVAFLRAPNGQTGMVKEGDDLGDIKLLRIGTNRVLVEQDGKKQELMIFAGYGGESLLSKTNDSSNETTKH